MPQASDELRSLMLKWFGNNINDVAPTRFLLSRGYQEFAGLWRPPTPSHTVSHEEEACLRFLVYEWDHACIRNMVLKPNYPYPWY